MDFSRPSFPAFAGNDGSLIHAITEGEPVKATTFVLLYLVVAAPTYLLPFLGSNSFWVKMVASYTDELVEEAKLDILDTDDEGTENGMGLSRFIMIVTLMHWACLIGLIVMTFFFAPRKWVTVLPFMAAFFDKMPGFSLILWVPTIFHVATIVFTTKYISDSKHEAAQRG